MRFSWRLPQLGEEGGEAGRSWIMGGQGSVAICWRAASGGLLYGL